MNPAVHGGRCLADGHDRDRVQEFFGSGVFDQVAAGAHAQRREDLLVLVVGGQHDDPDPLPGLGRH